MKGRLAAMEGRLFDARRRAVSAAVAGDTLAAPTCLNSRYDMRALRTTPLALLGLVALCVPGDALAEEIPPPTVNVAARAVPIPGFPGTGNFYGKGADVEATLVITGSGYGTTAQNPNGSPPPVSAVNVYLPKGVKLHPSGFPTCAE